MSDHSSSLGGCMSDIGHQTKGRVGTSAPADADFAKRSSNAVNVPLVSITAASAASAASAISSAAVSSAAVSAHLRATLDFDAGLV